MHHNLRSSSYHSQAESLEHAKAKFKARARFELEATGVSQKAVHCVTGMDEGQLSRVLSDKHPENFPAHLIPAWTREVGPGLLRWIAVQCGGEYVHEADPAPQAPAMMLVGLMARQSGASLQQLIQAFSDGTWSEQERQANLPGLRKLRDIVDQVIQQAEAGGAE